MRRDPARNFYPAQASPFRQKPSSAKGWAHAFRHKRSPQVITPLSTSPEGIRITIGFSSVAHKVYTKRLFLTVLVESGLRREGVPIGHAKAYISKRWAKSARPIAGSFRGAANGRGNESRRTPLILLCEVL